jgi:hypothetical protein
MCFLLPTVFAVYFCILTYVLLFQIQSRTLGIETAMKSSAFSYFLAVKHFDSYFVSNSLNKFKAQMNPANYFQILTRICRFESRVLCPYFG